MSSGGPLQEVLLFFYEVDRTGNALSLLPALTVGMIPGAAAANHDHEVTNQLSEAAGSLVHKSYSSCQPSLPWV